MRERLERVKVRFGFVPSLVVHGLEAQRLERSAVAQLRIPATECRHRVVDIADADFVQRAQRGSDAFPAQLCAQTASALARGDNSSVPASTMPERSTSHAPSAVSQRCSTRALGR